MEYEHIQNITHADVAVRVRGSTPEELFIKAGRALMSEMLDDISSIRPGTRITGEIRTTDFEMLYFEFLNDLLFYKDSRGLLLLPENISITRDSETYLCRYTLSGETIARKRHSFKVDIKAVTLHGLRLFREDDKYVAETVFDV